MRIAQKTGTKQLTIAEVPEPQIKHPDDVKIKVSYAGICTNDLMFWKDQISISYFGNGIGHEFSGIITDLGESAHDFGFSIGDRVSGLSWEFCGKCPFCRSGKENLCINISNFVGTMSEYIILKDRMVCRIPDNVSLEEGCLSEVVTTCLHGLERINITAGDSVLILGGGVSAQVFVQLAKMSGAVNITLCDAIKSKQILAKKLGANNIIDPTNENLVERAQEISESLGFNVIIDVFHDPSILPILPGILAKGGKILLFTQYKPNESATFNLSELYVKECSLITSYLAPYKLDTAMKVLPKLNMKSLIGEILPFYRVQDAFETYEEGLSPRILLKIN